MNGAARQAYRQAVYFAPPADHPLAARGAAWLGRDATGAPGAGGPAHAAVTEPWRYGFHATLKAPLRLVAGAQEAAWLDAVRAVARRHAPFDVPPLTMAMLGNFLALRPAHALPAAHPLHRLANDCVLQLDRWRAPPTDAERERQLKAGLSARQRLNVERLGYAHVLEDWRFHLTLSNPMETMDAAAASDLLARAERHFAEALRVPLRCDALCVFVEPAPGQPFELDVRMPLAG